MLNLIFRRQQNILKFYRCCHTDNKTLQIQELSKRSAFKVKGPEADTFLQGLITNDINHLKNSTSMYTLFLNSKGRVLADSIIYRAPEDDTFFIEVDTTLFPTLEKHMKMYILRKKVEVTNLELILRLWILFDTQSPIKTEIHPKIEEILSRKNPSRWSGASHTYEDALYTYKDPRSRRLGVRIITSTDLGMDSIQDILDIWNYIDENVDDTSSHKLLRYKLGIGEGVEELPPTKCFPMEANCDYLHGISLQKGCYLGQELTARTYHTGVIRKRLMPLIFNKSVEGDLRENEPIYLKEDNKVVVGKLRGVCGKYGIGLLRIDNALKYNDFICGHYEVKTERPGWWPLEAPREIVKKKNEDDVIEIIQSGNNLTQVKRSNKDE